MRRFKSVNDEFNFSFSGPLGRLGVGKPNGMAADHYREAIRRATACRMAGDEFEADEWFSTALYIKNYFQLTPEMINEEAS